MKKSFWGYNTKHADDLINAMQDKNDILTAKIARLTMQLSAADNSETEALKAKVGELEQTVSEMKRQEEALRASLDEANHKNALLKQECVDLLKKIDELHKSDDNKDAIERIGSLYMKAYSDGEKLQKTVAEEMKARVETCARIVAGFNNQMRQAVIDAQNVYDDMISSLADRLDTIFTSLSVIDNGNEALEQTLPTPEEIEKDLKSSLDEMTRQNLRVLYEMATSYEKDRNTYKEILSADQKRAAGQSVREEIEEETLSPVQQLRNKYFKNVPSGQIVSVYTNVSKNDLFTDRNKEAL